MRYTDGPGLNQDPLQRMTAQYIKPEQMRIVVAGDKAKITDQLAPYATGGEPKK